MSLLYVLSIFILIFLTSLFLTRKILYYATNKKILDYPGLRSLHETPTPRGGGISIVVSVLISLILLWIGEYISDREIIAFMSSGILVFVTGLLDDIKTLPTLAKGISYFAAAMLGIFMLSNEAPAGSIIGVLYMLFWSIVITWLINLYNFMDGSDGLAGLHTILVSFSICVISYLSGVNFLFYLMVIIAASTSGFLYYNYPPAKIFMGDAGSCFVGLIFGLCAFYCHVNNLVPIEIWLILLSIFICDTSLTLLMRFCIGRKWYAAHREHAYQKVILMKDSHEDVLFFLVAIYILLILPILGLSIYFEHFSWLFVMICYGILTAIWIVIQMRYRAYSISKHHV